MDNVMEGSGYGHFPLGNYLFDSGLCKHKNIGIEKKNKNKKFQSTDNVPGYGHGPL